MLRIVFLLVFSSVFEVHSEHSAVVEISGKGLILDDNTNLHNQKYSYTFKEPGHLDLSCSAWGLLGGYVLILQNERGIGIKKLFLFPENSVTTCYSVSYRFKLTSASRTISCTARGVYASISRYTSTVDLKYEPGPATAPSISSTTKPTATVPIEPATGSAEPQTPGESVMYIVIACLCVAIVVVCIIVIICNCCSRTQGVQPRRQTPAAGPAPQHPQ